jgi:regulatory protein
LIRGGDRAAGGGPSLRQRALGLLARRDHARAELARKLAPHCTEADNLDALLDDLERAGWLSDARVAEAVARSGAERHGPLRIAADLKRRGVAAGAIDSVVRDARASEVEQAAVALRRRFPEPPIDAGERARQGRFLQARGFGTGVIRQVLKRAGPDDDAGQATDE